MPSHSFAVGFLLSVCSLCVWGAWPFVRAYCKAEVPVFFVLYTLGGLFIALFCCISTSTSMVASYPASKICSVIFAGTLCGHGDFLVCCAFQRIPSYIAFPIYAGIAMVAGVILDYMLLSKQNQNKSMGGPAGRASMLFSGVFLGLCAILTLASADSRREKLNNSNEQFESKPDSLELADSCSKSIDKPLELNSHGSDIPPVNEVPSHNSTKFTPMEPARVDYESKDLPIFLPEIVVADVKACMPSFGLWVYVCIFAGILAAFWSPLSNLGMEGNDGIKSPFVRLLFYYTGYAITIPSGMLMQGYFDSSKKGTQSLIDVLQSASQHIVNFLTLPLVDKGWGVLTGVMVGSGFCFNFMASGMISPAAAFGVSACEPVANLLLAMAFADALLNCDQFHKMLLFACVVIFLSAILLMALSAS